MSSIEKRNNRIEIVTKDQLFGDPNLDIIEGIRARWASINLREVRTMMPEPIYDFTGRDQVDIVVSNSVGRLAGMRAVSAVVSPPAERESVTNKFLVYFSEYQQGYTPAQFIFAQVMREVLAPKATLVMFQNNMLGQNSHQMDKTLQEKIARDGLRALAIEKMNLLKKICPPGSEAIFTGYSLGANMALSSAGIEIPNLRVTHVNADEPVSATIGGFPRNRFDIRNDFMHSASYSDQISAIREAELPVLSQAFSRPRLWGDYLKFFLASLQRSNKAILEAVEGDVLGEVCAIKTLSPDTIIKLGQVAGSRVYQPGIELINKADINVFYDGFPQRHATCNNPFARALMASGVLKTS